ncbi:Polyketide cyclase / dehydrase and lipid transport [Rhizobiales bacterium GAS113]|nr:Polyketide cyclase / dehydrase and lipid transport [Rhizobiales bacterium GAS113]
MTTAYFSAVLPADVDNVWAVARDFGNYRLFTSGRGETLVEDEKRGDCVGAIRKATLDGRTVRQRLLSHSDADRCYQYEFCDQAPLPIENYLATLQFRPVVKDAQTFVEWTATFDCALDQRETIRRQLEGLFSTWISSLDDAIQNSK